MMFIPSSITSIICDKDGIVPNYRHFKFEEEGVWVETVTRRTISENELPPAIRERFARKSSEYNFSAIIDEDTTVSERKVSEAYVREQAKKFNRPIKRG